MIQNDGLNYVIENNAELTAVNHKKRRNRYKILSVFENIDIIPCAILELKLPGFTRPIYYLSNDSFTNLSNKLVHRIN